MNWTYLINYIRTMQCYIYFLAMQLLLAIFIIIYVFQLSFEITATLIITILDIQRL